MVKNKGKNLFRNFLSTGVGAKTEEILNTIAKSTITAPANAKSFSEGAMKAGLI